MLPCRGQNTTFIGNSNGTKPLTVQKILFSKICISPAKKWSVILKQKEPCKLLHGSFKNEMGRRSPGFCYIFFECYCSICSQSFERSGFKMI